VSTGWAEEYPLDGGVGLRRWRRAHAGALDAAVTASIGHLRPWMAWIAGEPAGLAARTELVAAWERSWDAGREWHWGFFDGDAVLGSVGVMDRQGPGVAEVGYWLVPAATGRGLVTRAVALLTAASLRRPGVTTVQIRHDRANTASAAVPARLGFVLVAEVDEPVAAPGETGVTCVWEARGAWPQPPAGP
jgi:RimJ/RimL family protein N-acetyltransferase